MCGVQEPAYTSAVKKLRSLSRLTALCVLFAAGCSKADAPPPAKKASADADAPAQTEKTPPAAPAPKPPVVAAKVGDAAPAFTLEDVEGKKVSLADFAGKNVVLEWFNPGCPFVVYAHESGPLKDMAASTVGEDTVWIAINSGAPGKQGHGAPANSEAMTKWSMGHPVLMDPSGEVGRQYGATKTPQVFLIDTSGVLRYAGALDNAPIGKVDGDDPYANHLANAVAQLRAGKPVNPGELPPYGCSVKYAS